MIQKKTTPDVTPNQLHQPHFTQAPWSSAQPLLALFTTNLYRLTPEIICPFPPGRCIFLELTLNLRPSFKASLCIFTEFATQNHRIQHPPIALSSPNTDRMPSSRAPTKDVPPGPEVPQKVRKSILVDPDEPRAAREARRRSRSKERPRLRSPPSDETISGRYVKHRNGKVDFIPDRAHDLEHKNSESNRQFRGKRDGYESEEGMQLRKERVGGGKPRPRRRVPVDSDDENGIGPKTTAALGAGAGAAATAAAAGGAAATARRRRPPPLDYDDRRPAPRRRGYYDDEGYETEAPPRRARWDLDDDDMYAGGRRRPPPRVAPATMPMRPRRYADDDDYYDPRPPPDMRRARSERRPPPRDDYYSDRDRRGSRRGGPPAAEKKDWKKDLMAEAMPVVKREGGRFLKKELGNFLAQQAARH